MPLRAQTFDSNGPEGRIRGTAHQVYEKYLALARDASAQSDRIRAENLLQHAEHYSRIINESMDPEDEANAAAGEREAQAEAPRDGQGEARDEASGDGGGPRDGGGQREAGRRGNGRGRQRRRYPGNRGDGRSGGADGGNGAAAAGQGDGQHAAAEPDGEAQARNGAPAEDDGPDDAAL